MTTAPNIFRFASVLRRFCVEERCRTWCLANTSLNSSGDVLEDTQVQCRNFVKPSCKSTVMQPSSSPASLTRSPSSSPSRSMPCCNATPLHAQLEERPSLEEARALSRDALRAMVMRNGWSGGSNPRRKDEYLECVERALSHHGCPTARAALEQRVAEGRATRMEWQPPVNGVANAMHGAEKRRRRQQRGNVVIAQAVDALVARAYSGKPEAENVPDALIKAPRMTHKRQAQQRRVESGGVADAETKVILNADKRQKRLGNENHDDELHDSDHAPPLHAVKRARKESANASESTPQTSSSLLKSETKQNVARNHGEGNGCAIDAGGVMQSENTSDANCTAKFPSSSPPRASQSALSSEPSMAVGAQDLRKAESTKKVHEANVSKISVQKALSSCAEMHAADDAEGSHSAHSAQSTCSDVHVQKPLREREKTAIVHKAEDGRVKFSKRTKPLVRRAGTAQTKASAQIAGASRKTVPLVRKIGANCTRALESECNNDLRESAGNNILAIEKNCQDGRSGVIDQSKKICSSENTLTTPAPPGRCAKVCEEGDVKVAITSAEGDTAIGTAHGVAVPSHFMDALVRTDVLGKVWKEHGNRTVLACHVLSERDAPAVRESSGKEMEKAHFVTADTVVAAEAVAEALKDVVA